MSNKKSLTDAEIGAKLRAGQNFWVGTERERKLVLMAAKFADAKVSSRAAECGGFTIFFLNAVPA